MTLHDKLIHVVTEYDQKEEAKAAKAKPGRGYYNRYALPQYIGAVQKASAEIEAGITPRKALTGHFNGRLLDRLLKVAGEGKSTREEKRGSLKDYGYNPGGDAMTFSTKAAADGYARLIEAEGIKSITAKKGVIKPKWTVTPQRANTRKPTIYEALQTKLGRVPTNAELKADVERIKREAIVEMAGKGKLSHQRKGRRGNPEGAAASMYESFHGSPSTGTLVIEDKVHFHEHLAELGVLCGLKVRTVGGEDYTLEFAATGQERAGNPAKLPIYSASITQAKDIPSVTHGFTALTNARKAAAKIGSQLIVQVKDSKLKHVVYMIPAPGFSAADLDAIVRRPGGGFRAHENPKGKGKKSGPIADAYKFSKGIVPGLVSGADQLLMGKNPRRRRNSVDAGPVILCSNEKGNQLYFRGGDQSLNLADLKMDDLERDCMNIGEVWGIAYTTKKEFDNFAEIEYVHVFGPEKFNIRMPKRADLWEDAQPPKDQAFGCGELPTLTYDTLNKALHVIGGSYKIDQPMLSTSPGIEG